MNQNIDILDLLQEEKGYVKLLLTSGKEVFGRPLFIAFDEDDEGWETIKMICFKRWPEKRSIFYKLDDIQSYERCKKEDLPQPGGK